MKLLSSVRSGRVRPPSGEEISEWTIGFRLQLEFACLTLVFASGLGPEAQSALAWHEGSGHRSAAVEPSGARKTGFTAMPASLTGIIFTNHLSDRAAAQNRILENGSGVALGDVDGDGLCDIYLCRLEGGNALYRNLGEWRFEDVTRNAGVECPGQFSAGAVFADPDGDADLDLLVTSLGGGTRLFLNDGTGRFSESTGSGLLRKFGGTTMALGDIDGDGDLDLYTANYRTTTYKDAPPGVKAEVFLEGGRMVVKPSDRFVLRTNQVTGRLTLIERGEPDVLYVNKGAARFGPVSWTGGAFVDEEGRTLTHPPFDWGLCAAFRDLNRDGAPDLYVCNDFIFSTDKIWVNEEGRRFGALPELALRCQSRSSMAVDFADINRDGHDDFIVVDMLSRNHAFRHRQRANLLSGVDPGVADPGSRPEVMRNTLFLNRGDGTYAEIAQLAGVAASEWSWSVVFLDVDMDGFEDLLITNGNNHDSLDVDVMNRIVPASKNPTAQEHYENLLMFPRLETANLAFRNRGDLTFAEVGADWGFNAAGISHGMALGDLDNDGDLDVVVNNLHRAAGVYRNDSSAPRVAIRLRGKGANTRGIGARIEVRNGAVPMQSQEMICGGRYLSCDDSIRVFAAGDPTNQMTVAVTWRNGTTTILQDAEANRIYEIAEPNREDSSRTRHTGDREHPHRVSGIRFSDVRSLLNHRHHEEPFPDFERQPLLFHGLGRLGPGVAWCDFDGDGWDDLVVGSGRGGRPAVFRNEGHGRFTRSDDSFLPKAVSGDWTGIAGVATAPGGTVLFAGLSNYESAPGARSSVIRVDFAERKAEELPPGSASAAGPLAVADIDGDGDLDLFAGGRVNPRRYPEPASSQLFRNEGGRWILDPADAALMSGIGLVSGALFTDLNGDGFPELVLACEWGAVRVFRNHAGTFSEITVSVGLAAHTGWWNSVAAGDFDGDGRMDLVAGNWGRNTPYWEAMHRPLRCYYSDLNGDGIVELVEAYSNPLSDDRPVPRRSLDTLAAVLPALRDRFPTYRSYSEATVEAVLADRFQTAVELQATTLDSMVFLNRGDHFEAKPLPVEAQFAPVFGVVVGDADGDGKEDIFVAQNFFDIEPETSRYDAGLGVWLRGDGLGNFAAVAPSESGISIFGEQRGCALADYDHDGRVDLCVAQNGSATLLFRNEQARPGLRVRLKGPPANPSGIGAVLRFEFSSGNGAAREVHAGSGYWSQNSAVQVLGILERPPRLRVRWPGGRQSSFEIPESVSEIEAGIDGTLKVIQ